MSDINYGSFFHQLDDKSKNENSSAYNESGKSSFLFNLTKTANLGTVVLRPISDKNGLPMRLVHDVYELFYDKGEDTPEGDYRYENFSVPGFANYSRLNLNQAQKTLIEELRNILEIMYNDPDAFEGYSVNWRSEISFFYAKLFNHVTQDKGSIGGDGSVRLIRHHSANFYRTLSQTINDKTRVKGSEDWMSKYFNRVPGKYEEVMVITTTRPNIKYEINIAFDTGKAYELTSEDIDKTDCLFSSFMNVREFDEAYYSKWLTRLKSNLNLINSSDREESGAKIFDESAEKSTKPSKVDEFPI